MRPDGVAIGSESGCPTGCCRPAMTNTSSPNISCWGTTAIHWMRHWKRRSWRAGECTTVSAAGACSCRSTISRGRRPSLTLRTAQFASTSNKYVVSCCVKSALPYLDASGVAIHLDGAGNRRLLASQTGKHAYRERYAPLWTNALALNRSSDLRQTQRRSLWRNEKPKATTVPTHKTSMLTTPR
jgi:hypothetical protein